MCCALCDVKNPWETMILSDMQYDGPAYIVNGLAFCSADNVLMVTVDAP